jgi:hypothetical protein
MSGMGPPQNVFCQSGGRSTGAPNGFDGGSSFGVARSIVVAYYNTTNLSQPVIMGGPPVAVPCPTAQPVPGTTKTPVGTTRPRIRVHQCKHRLLRTLGRLAPPGKTYCTSPGPTTDTGLSTSFDVR